MFDLFGAEMPLAVRFFLAFLIVLGLIGVTAWAVRRLGSGRLGSNGVRGRQPRIAVIDHAGVDGRRRLILVRRDNVEHLLMVGGPTDVVVEANIVRATSAARDVPGARPSTGTEALPRTIPLPELASNGSWPLQPEPSGLSSHPGAPRRTPRSEPAAEEAGSSQLPTETPSRARDSSAALTDDPAARPPLAPAAPIAAAPSRGRPTLGTRPQPAEARTQAQPASPEAIAAADQTLAEMAQRLEAALRKPKTADAPSPRPATTPVSEQNAVTEIPAGSPSPPASLRPARPVEAKPSRPEAKTKEGKAIYETLEQEMANLLGRPPNKTG